MVLSLLVLMKNSFKSSVSPVYFMRLFLALSCCVLFVYLLDHNVLCKVPGAHIVNPGSLWLTLM